MPEAAAESGLSRGTISQLIHGYEHKGRGERSIPVLKGGVHWSHELRGWRVHTGITPKGVERLRRVKNCEVRQKKVGE